VGTLSLPAGGWLAEGRFVGTPLGEAVAAGGALGLVVLLLRRSLLATGCLAKATPNGTRTFAEGSAVGVSATGVGIVGVAAVFAAFEEKDLTAANPATVASESDTSPMAFIMMW
jgi:hypothetical protein